MNSEKINKVKELLYNKKKIVIVCHRNPDGDAYGSSLALSHFLKKLSHEVRNFTPNLTQTF